MSNSSKPDNIILAKLCYPAFIWKIWNEINSRMFSNMARPRTLCKFSKFFSINIQLVLKHLAHFVHFRIFQQYIFKWCLSYQHLLHIFQTFLEWTFKWYWTYQHIVEFLRHNHSNGAEIIILFCISSNFPNMHIQMGK